ncbi:MAG: DNA polymerase Y family protein [Sphingobium sp.]|uniref:Y-family DNA polymerase n=1 Tax=Sphingomonas sp. MM-1 TaxID=745310 RepID=UPI0002C07FFD|nr:DNA polymerase Y family protein [Sphingomonas sp. MM-1]AGH51526.1 putative nucleotidyltransferase [Sphingomonas sp. MM-1]MDX3901802.1 DNA polymerase Y family protein [Sphingobium sp.]TNE42933.1 MAG: DNA polymerase Y family protein [Sphingomonadales bacterium]UBS33928.1 DNA polymerase Y family protein [Altererythrobacter sp. N1]
MTRAVSLFLPSWPTDRLIRTLGASAPSPETPLALVGREGRKRLILAFNAAARAEGIMPGMAVAKAQALVAGLDVRDADPAGDEAALERLAIWALRRYSPIVAADPPDGLRLDMAGASHLLGGEEGFVADLAKRLADTGIAARIAIAPTYGAAHGLARFSRSPLIIVEPGDLDAQLAPLPIAALRLDAATVDSLRRLGVDTVGELAAMPRAPLTLRFGPEVGRRLDQAYGRTGEPFELVEAPELIRVRRAFAEPIGAPETLARYTGKLVVQLCEELEREGLGARRLDLLFTRVDNRIEAIRAGTAKPLRDVKRMTRLLCDKIETIAPGFGIELMTLTASIAEPLDYRSTATSLIDPATPDLSDLVDTLANRVAHGRLYRCAPTQSEVPERSVARIEPLAAPIGVSWPNDWPRPSRLLDPPAPVEAMALLPDHPPASFTWGGVRRRVKRADGPERIFGEWWVRDGELSVVRDYFQVEDEAGERFWLFRRGDGEDPNTGDHRWYLHGIFA